MDLILLVILTIIVIGILIYATDYLTFLQPNLKNAVKFLWIILGLVFILYRSGIV